MSRAVAAADVSAHSDDGASGGGNDEQLADLHTARAVVQERLRIVHDV